MVWTMWHSSASSAAAMTTKLGKVHEVGEIEAAGVRRAVGADQSCPVHCESHRQVLDRHVVHHLIVGALQEGRVNRAKRPVTLRRQAGGEGHAMLLRNPDVERTLGESLGHLVEARARGHRRGDRHNFVVARHLVAERLGEHARVARRPRCGLGLHAGDDVELDHAVIFVGGVLGRRVALALLGHDMDQHRPDLGVADVLEHFDQRADVVPVDRPHIIEAQLLEERAAGEPAARIFLHPPERAVERVGHRPRELLRELARRQIFSRGDEAGERVA